MLPLPLAGYRLQHYEGRMILWIDYLPDDQSTQEGLDATKRTLAFVMSPQVAAGFGQAIVEAAATLLRARH